MNQPLVIQEFVIVLAAKNHNPSLLNPDFLKYSGIVPTDWELARPPVSSRNVTSITFKEGISIVAEPNRVLFKETIENKAAAEIIVPDLARKYVQSLPKLEYLGLAFNLLGYTSYENQPEAPRKYVTEKLLSPGNWQEVGTTPMQATVNLVYTLERSVLNLSVNSGSLRFPDEKTVPVVLFTGNFGYNINSPSEEERLLRISQLIENWQADLETYKDIINTKFLATWTFNTASIPEKLPISA